VDAVNADVPEVDSVPAREPAIDSKAELRNAAIKSAQARLAQAQPAREPATETDSGVFGRIAEDLTARGQTISDAASTPNTGFVNSLGKGADIVGSVAGGLLDVGGELASSGFKLLGKGVSAVTPDFAEDFVIDAVKETSASIVGADIAQAGLEAAGRGVEAYNEWESNHPDAAKIVNGLANVALVAAPVKSRPAPTGPGFVGKKIDKVTGKLDQIREDFIGDLTGPVKTRVVRESEALRSVEGGLLGRRTVTKTPKEAEIAKSVSELPGVKDTNSSIANLNVIKDGIESKAKSLESSLAGSEVTIPRIKTRTALDGVIENLKLNPLLVGDAAKSAERVVANARAIIKSNPATPAGLLKSRKELDALIDSQKPKIFNPATDSALSIAVRETRQSINDIIAESVPSASVKESLRSQSNLYGALDNVAAKAAVESDLAVGRTFDRLAGTIGLKSLVSARTTLATAGITATLATGIAAGLPVAGIALAAGGGLALTAAARSKAAKKGYRQLLRLTETAIKKTGTPKEVVKQLRGDRALLIEMVKNSDALSSIPRPDDQAE
jgi:hypothetical protein